MSLNAGAPTWLALGIAVAAGVIIGVVLATPIMGMAEEHVMLMTMSMSILAASIVSAVPALGGQQGLFGLPVANLGFSDLIFPSDYAPWLFGFLVVILLICWRLGESPFGRMLRASQNNELGVQSLGKSPRRARVFIFAAMSGVTALAGALLVFFNGISAPSMFSLDQTMLVFAMVIIGGVASIPGSILGAFFIVMVTPVMVKTFGLPAEDAALVRPIVFGILLVIVMRIRPSGIIRERHAQPRVSAARPDSAEPVEVVPPAPTGSEVVVDVENLSKRFGGIVAVDDLSIQLRRGQITALIGPNGAGKSTVFNLITGAIAPDAGVVRLFGRNITGLSPQRVAQLGMVRSFQDLRIFPKLTPLENVMLAHQQSVGENALRLFFSPLATRRAERAAAAHATTWLEFVGIDPRTRAMSGSLSFAQQKQVVFARVLATDAEIFLLDEPMSGVEGSAAEEMLALIERMRSLGHTICIVEHSIRAVSRLADRAYFMETGRVTAEGTVDELLADRRLAEVYFGVA